MKDYCDHDWHIWPETDGQEQRCSLCKGYRPTPAMLLPAANVTLDAQEVSFLAARLRRLFAFHDYTLPGFTADDGALIHTAGACLGAVLTKAVTPQPINMLLFCPKCKAQHIDKPDPNPHWCVGCSPDGSNGTKVCHGCGDGAGKWKNPPHRSHLCHACGCIWRPADVPTNGVAAISTRGKGDNWPAATAVSSDQHGADWAAAEGAARHTICLPGATVDMEASE